MGTRVPFGAYFLPTPAGTDPTSLFLPLLDSRRARAGPSLGWASVQARSMLLLWLSSCNLVSTSLSVGSPGELSARGGDHSSLASGVRVPGKGFLQSRKFGKGVERIGCFPSSVPSHLDVVGPELGLGRGGCQVLSSKWHLSVGR